jgi:hypothetical protein
MTVPVSDEYAFLLGKLSSALENSYTIMKESALSCEDADYSRIVTDRLRAFYCSQVQVKTFIDKRFAQAGALTC